MSIDIPPDWVEVDRVEFKRLLSDVNWRRDDFGFTRAIKWDGVHDRLIGFSDSYDVRGRYFIDPEFFK